MKLIIDCGSTKADWVIIDNKETMMRFTTDGFNPNYTSKESILNLILDNSLYKPYTKYITEVFFYGSGCGNIDNCNTIEAILSSVFTSAEIIVTHDMMAACRAIHSRKKGIACILGTGSNSCLYDGKRILDRAISLGFILGDEGSGSHLGKKLLHDYFYKKMPDDLSKIFECEYKLNINSFIKNVYHNEQPSKYLASFSKFLYDNRNHSFAKELCSKCFDEFIENYILRYENNEHIEIGFVGSIAYYFQDIIRERLEIKGLKPGKILKDPIDGLIEYHSC